MTPNERADFLAWLNRLDLTQLKEVSSHVGSVITHKRGAKLRLLHPGAQIVFTLPNSDQTKRWLGTVVKLFKTSVEVEDEWAVRTRVDVDHILGLHTGGMDYAPLESAQPLGFPQVPQVVEQQLAPTEFSTARDGLPGGDLEDFNPPMDWEPPKE